MAVSGPAVWTSYTFALLVLFVPNANCKVYYTSAAYSKSPTLIRANLDDGDLKGVCVIDDGTPWSGAGSEMQMDCGDSGYAATATFGQPDDNGYINCVISIESPGFTGSIGTDECQFNCDCGSSDCGTWTGLATW
ncbi:unnamed protein product [Calypogeia fissa]